MRNRRPAARNRANSTSLPKDFAAALENAPTRACAARPRSLSGTAKVWDPARQRRRTHCGKVAPMAPDTSPASLPEPALGAEPGLRILEALAFDDVLIVPGYSQVLPAETDTSTHLTRSIALRIPLISAAMDTVSE